MNFCLELCYLLPVLVNVRTVPHPYLSSFNEIDLNGSLI